MHHLLEHGKIADVAEDLVKLTTAKHEAKDHLDVNLFDRKTPHLSTPREARVGKGHLTCPAEEAMCTPSLPLSL